MRNDYLPTEEGIWEVLGEDTNADLGGSHQPPLLGYYEGTYRDVAEYAKTLRGWVAWGAGGSIRKIKVMKLNPETIARKKQLENEKQNLENALQEVKNQLDSL